MTNQQVADVDPLTGEQAKQLRQARGWSQARLASEAHVSPRMVRDFESGRRKPQQANLDALLRALVPGEVDVTETRQQWDDDVKLYLDILGAFLMALPSEERLLEMRAIMTDIGHRRSPLA